MCIRDRNLNIWQRASENDRDYARQCTTFTCAELIPVSTFLLRHHFRSFSARRKLLVPFFPLAPTTAPSSFVAPTLPRTLPTTSFPSGAFVALAGAPRLQLLPILLLDDRKARPVDRVILDRRHRGQVLEPRVARTGQETAAAAAEWGWGCCCPRGEVAEVLPAG